MFPSSKIISATFLGIILSACGGGGGSENPTGTAVSPNESTGPFESNTGSSGNSGGTSGGTGASTGPTTPLFAYDTTARFDSPGDINIDGAGNLYLMDRGTQKIRRIAVAGEVTTLPGTYRPFTDIAVDTTGNVFILIYNPELDVQGRDGTELHKLARDGTQTLLKRYQHVPGSSNPRSVATGSRDSLYVLSQYRESYAIERLDPDNASRQVYSLAASSVHALTADAQGNIYFSVTGFDNSRSIQRLQPDGTQSVVVPFNESSPVTGNLTVIANMSVDAQGNIYVANYRSENGADETGMAIHKIAPSGAVTAIRIGPPGSTGQVSESDYDRTYGKSYVASGSDGNLYATYEDNHTVYRINQTGETTLIAGKAGEAGNSD